MNSQVFLQCVVVACLVQQSACIFWNWGESKPKPVDGGWSSWTSWSSCKISLDKDTLPFRYKERNCSNPAPKDGGVDCKGLSKRISGCDDCNLALGLESGAIQDSFLSASDSHESFPASLARLNGKSSWCSDNPDNMQEQLHLQVELKTLTIVSAISTQGFYPPPETLSLRMGRVSKYQLEYSIDGITWEVYKNSKNEVVLSGNTDRVGTVRNDLSPPVTARFIRILPLSYFSFICMKLELYGCSFNCGGPLTETPGNVITESSPSEDRDCLWLIQLPNTTKLIFDFINFNIPCSNGYTELRDGGVSYSSAPVLARYCGYDHTPPPVSSNSGKLWVRFKSNATDPQVGFYSIYFPGCGKHLQGNSGEIKSPNFPNEYFHNSKCIWTITVPEGKSIHLEFVAFDVEGDSNRHRCPHDYLAIWNGSDTSAPLIGRFCNSNPPSSLICSSGRNLRLKFRSDDALAWTGFHLTYRVVDSMKPCSEMILSSVIMPTSSRFGVSSMPLTPTPVMTTESNMEITPHTLFSSAQDTIAFSRKLESVTGLSAFTATPQSYSVVTNSTGLLDAPSDHDVQAANRKDDNDDDDDDLTTMIIISVFAFIVLCMIIASIAPSIKHHYATKRREKYSNMILGAGSSIPETNSKETFEDKMLPEETPCEPFLYKDPNKLEQEKLADSTTPSETNMANLDQEEDATDTVIPVPNDKGDVETSEESREEEEVDVEAGSTELDESAALEWEDEIPEVNSLNVSYENLGSSFATEMQAMLSQFVDETQEESWKPNASKNPENSPQDNENPRKSWSNDDLEAGECIPSNKPAKKDETKPAPPSQATGTDAPLEPNTDSLSNSDPGDIWELQPDYVTSHSCRSRPAGAVRISGSCTDSKDSGCASSCENLPSVDNYLLHTADTETCV